MDMRQFCFRLKVFREKGVSFTMFTGTRWLLMKVIIAVVAIAMFLSDDMSNKSVALLIFGYLVGTVASVLRQIVVAKRCWPFQEKIINWDLVSQHLGEN